MNDGRIMVGKPICDLDLERLLHRVGDCRARHVEADLAHGLAEQVTVLGLVDGLATGADHLHTVLLENTFAYQVERTVQRRLPTHRRQQRIRAFPSR